MTCITNSRALAARAVARVFGGSSLDDAIAEARRQAAPRDLPLIRSMAYGVLREHGQLLALANAMLARPLHEEPELLALIEVGLYQLRRMRIPAHAAVADTVAAATVLDRPHHAGLVNALLRRYQREREALEAALPGDAPTRFNHPAWLIDAIRADWPADWQRVLEAANEHPPLSLRVNRRRISREAYLDRLRAAGLAARAVAECADAVVLDSAVPVESLPGFDAGEVAVQDVSAQLMADLLRLEDGLRLLDACAAPGGKTSHALERASLDVLALDIDARRLGRVHDNLRRLGHSATVRAADAGLPRDWWDGRPFDRILLDAPCSGTGVIRRHPDIRWLRRADDIERLARTQLYLLRTLWGLLAPGGVLVYASCSVLSAEGEQVARRFLMEEPQAKHDPIEADWGERLKLGRRIAPGGVFDGFYYVRLVKPPRKR